MTFFIIHQKLTGNGFSARLAVVLEQLDIMEETNSQLIPYFDWQTIVSNMRDNTNDKTLNEWEYCFEQDYKYEEVFSSNHVFSSGLYTGRYHPQQKYFKLKNETIKLHNLFKKYIKIKPEIIEKINKDIKKEKTLGVHCRRSDMVRDHSNIGLNYTEEEFFNKTYKIFSENNFEKMYLATEEITILEYFKKQLGDKLIYQDCFRVYREESPVFKADDRPLHRTKQQQEVLLDILNLAECNTLICGISSVSNTAIYINGLKYNEVYYFDEI